MAFENPSREEIKTILEQVGNIAVVGLSDKSDRTSYMVSYAMQKRGYRIIPVNPAAAGQTILGETCYASLAEVPEPVELVNVFRRSEYCAEVAREAAAIGAKILWLQQGIISQEAADIAQEHGMTVIMDRCIKVEDSVTQAVRKG
ncbi:CoA-binding protein [Paenibacillus sp. SEL3]|jgi:predicted CoA-binding protein|uniref:CoA-binding protein n=2 Tax=Paenibacillus TaxID=44249 RepID=A0A0K2FBC4_9BACL|nr:MULTISPECIES: CoA-binding protein [Paenibacillus]ADM70788.1 CoA-binding protein [Paenibacillus polymyxa E681]AIW40656.1 CoA-binding protein [Paenibacillus polymyxa CR1]ALA42940.1 CoA-binding protein [Paenibacillus peoriae]APB70609.1 CoA-binding protein [Paenibacillus polymyxa]APB75266.1 CoA-binding protein [Paenibacillus polymyxa]